MNRVAAMMSAVLTAIAMGSAWQVPAEAQSIKGGMCSLLTVGEVSAASGGEPWTIVDGEDKPESCSFSDDGLDESGGPAGSPSASPDALPDPCALLTSDEVSVAMGGQPISVVPLEPGFCVYMGDTTADPRTSLVVTLTLGESSVVSYDLVRASEPTAVEIQVAGVPALQFQVADPATGSMVSALHMWPDPATWLVLVADAPAEVDVAAALPGLGELAVTRLATMAASSPAP